MTGVNALHVKELNHSKKDTKKTLSRQVLSRRRFFNWIEMAGASSFSACKHTHFKQLQNGNL